MADRFPGGVISKTPPTVVAPVDGEGGSASGVWTLDEQLGLQKAGSWPQGILPRELYAWGSNGIGGLGDGTTAYRSSPVQVGSLTNWGQVSAGSYHTGAVKMDGTMWFWGFNSYGRLGDNTTVNKSSPTQIGALTNWAQASAGYSRSGAIKTGGTLWVWGRNDFGRVGDGTTINRSSPVQAGAAVNWVQITIGNSHGLGISSAGELYGWGENIYNGRNTTGNVYNPAKVGTLSNWARVDSERSTAAIKTDGTLWTWGRNSRGSGGTNQSANFLRSSPVQVGSLTNWSQAFAGYYHMVALKTDGTLWAWGYGRDGAVGDGTRIDRSSPVQIGSGTDWSRVGAGGGSVSAGIKTAGTIWSWGRNNIGTLGQNDTISRSSPVQIGSSTNWSQVDIGSARGSETMISITKG